MTPRTLTALAVAATVAAAAVLVAGPGYDAARVRMHSGGIWLASVHTGQLTLMDGATAEVRTKVQVAEPGTALSVVQQGSTAYALNQRTGRLSRVDSAAEQASRPVSVLPASDGLIVKPAPDALHVLDVHSGTIASADLNTLASRGESRRLARAVKPDDVVVDGRGRLWALDEAGDLVWLAEGERRRSSAAGEHGRLAITLDQPVVVDPEHGRVDLLSPESGAVVRSSPVGLRPNDAVTVIGSTERSRVLIANSTRGELITCTFDTGTCAEPVRVGTPGAEFGNPVEIDNHAVVPDHSTGQATVVDLATARVVAQRELFARPTRFELFTRDGIVFFNDPNGDTAGVLDLTGGVRTIVKYADGPADAEAPPTPDPRALAIQVPKTGQRVQPPGLGIARPAVQPATTSPAPPLPASGASIAISPDSHGVVGEEFELTVVLRSPAGGWNARWRLGDGTELSGTTIRHRWRQPGVFTVQATADFATGARVLAEAVVTVELPEAPPRITALTVQRPKPVVGESVRFSATSTGQPDSWAWTVTKPGRSTPEVTSQAPEFRHAFGTPGTYTVTLTVTKGARTTSSTGHFTVARGAVKAWGTDTHGQTAVPSSAGSGVVAIAAGAMHCLALKSDGSVIGWGSDERGQAVVPQRATSGVIAISAGTFHSLALKADGSVVAWGANDASQTDVPLSAEHDVIAIAAGHDHSLALRKDGSVVAWGGNGSYQSRVPPEAMSGVTAIAAGRLHSMALKADGSVVLWGRAEPNVPPVPVGPGSGVVAIAAGWYVGMAVKSDGSVIGWGSSRDQVLPVPGNAMSGVVAVSLERHVLALKADGSVIGWGGNGGPAVPPEYSTGVLAVAAGARYSMVLL
ncbi:PKD domain-containing protein [Lentzea kentuckyensis]|uniref:PKD domain-containing protein n=1 Tax=Lentzea kentuckyensis TaxID=360086 RepID=UPI000A36CB1B|nr:PKD domain-containing protein [Lentzea kentuckyensis]